MSNFILAMMEAVSKDQTTLSSQEITDAKTTELDVQSEENIYLHWNGDGSVNNKGVLGTDVDNVINNEGNTNAENALNAKYNKDSTTAQGIESQMDGTTQTAQSQTSADGTNLQMKAQLVQGLMSIMSTTSNLLGRLLG